jgi:hypothetical protein
MSCTPVFILIENETAFRWAIAPRCTLKKKDDSDSFRHILSDLDLAWKMLHVARVLAALERKLKSLLLLLKPLRKEVVSASILVMPAFN